VLVGFNNHQQFAEVPVLVQVTVKLLGRVLAQVRTGTPKATTGGVVSVLTADVYVVGMVLVAAGMLILRVVGIPIKD